MDEHETQRGGCCVSALQTGEVTGTATLHTAPQVYKYTNTQIHNNTNTQPGLQTGGVTDAADLVSVWLS